MTSTWTQWLVSGRVQGVGFRWFVLRKAEDLGVVGWVANLTDGRVQVVARGGNQAIESLDALLRRGPRLAAVSHVERSVYQHEVDEIKMFEIR
ncbi:MAG: acylphosphatase [Candidatus Methylomirabilota bacterium]